MDIASKTLRDNRKKLFVPEFINIKKHFDDTDANDKLIVTNVENGVIVEVYHNSTKNHKPILGDFTSNLTAEIIGGEYHYLILIHKGPGDTELFKGKTDSAEKMISKIKNVYNWD